MPANSETLARRKIREVVEARGYILTEMWWEPWRAASEMEGIGGGWFVYVEARDGSEIPCDMVQGLSWREVIETFETDRDFPDLSSYTAATNGGAA